MDKMRRRSNSVLKRIAVRLFKITVFVVLPVGVFLFTSRLKQMEVVGAQRYTPDQIRERLYQSELDRNTVITYLKYSYFEKVDIPFVEKLDLKWINMNTIEVRVYEKVLTGCVEFMGEYLYFDKDGIVVESSPVRLTDIPLIKGLKFNQIILNKELEVQKKELFDVILNLTQLIDKYELDISVIQFSSKYEVTVDCANITALLGKRSTYDEVLLELRNIIREMESKKNQDVSELGTKELLLDMRNFDQDTKTIIAKPKQPKE